MSQHDFDIANQAGAPFRADLNLALQALASLNAGATAPATTYAYQPWYDTTLGLLKFRNGSNSAWVIFGPVADASQHVIYVNNLAKIYVNADGEMGVGVATPGYAIDVAGDVNVTGNFKINGANIPTSTSFYNCGSAGGTANAITASADPTISAYAAGQLFLVLLTATNTTTTPTANISAIGAKNIKKQIGLSKVNPAVGDLQSGTYALMAYDGTDIILTNPRTYAQGADIASAGTVNLDTATGDYVHITGTTAITAVTLSQGRQVTAVFDGALTLTNGASLIVPGAANLTTAAGDIAVLRGESSGVVRVVSYVRASGGSITQRVLQIKTVEKTDTFTSATADAWTDITGLTISITPTRSTTKILAFAHLQLVNGGTSRTAVRLVRDSTAFSVGAAASSRQRATAMIAAESDSSKFQSTFIQGKDAPGDTSAHDYKVQFYQVAGTVYLNRDSVDTDNADFMRCVSSITLMEIEES